MKALTIFDIDSTLMHTDARVYVINKHGHRKALSTEEFAGHKLVPGEEYEWTEFRDAKLFYETSKPIRQIWKTATNTLVNVGRRPGSKVIIMTARGELDNTTLFIETFRKHGMNMDNVTVYTVSGAKNKKPTICHLLEETAYSECRLFDDHEENITDFLSLHTEFPNLTFKAFPVGIDGTVKRPIKLGPTACSWDIEYDK